MKKNIINIIYIRPISLICSIALIFGILFIIFGVLKSNGDSTFLIGFLSIGWLFIAGSISYWMSFLQKERHNTKQGNIEYLRAQMENVNSYLNYLMNNDGKEYIINKKWNFKNQISYLQNIRAKLTDKLGKIISNEEKEITEKENYELRTNSTEDFKIIWSKANDIYKENLTLDENKKNKTFKDLFELLIGKNFVLENTNLSFFSKNIIPNLNFNYSDLTRSNLTSANLTSANLTSTNLTSANLNSANLNSANLTFANLTSALLNSAILTKSFCKIVK